MSLKTNIETEEIDVQNLNPKNLKTRADVKNTEILDSLTKFLKIIAEPNRLMILSILQDGELSVGQLQEQLQLPLNLVSFHLRPLKKFGLITSRKQGLSIFYNLDESKVCTYRHILNLFLCERCALEGLNSC